jgi:hypothetical protein
MAVHRLIGLLKTGSASQAHEKGAAASRPATTPHRDL